MQYSLNIPTSKAYKNGNKNLKISVLFLCLFPYFCQAESLSDCNKHLDSLLNSPDYKVDLYKGSFAKKAFLDSNTRRFRTYFHEVLATDTKVALAGHFGLAIWGCGSPCFNLGLVNLKTGKASIGPYYSYSVEYLPHSQIIIIDKAESQRHVEIFKWLLPRAYRVKADGEYKLIYQCKLDRKRNG